MKDFIKVVWPNFPWFLFCTIGVVTVLPLLSLGLLWQGGYHDTQRWFELFWLLIAGFYFAFLIIKKYSYFNFDFSRGVIGFLVFGFYSSLLSQNFSYSAFEFSVFFLLCILASVISFEMGSNYRIKLESALNLVLLGSLLYEFKALATYVAALFSGMGIESDYLLPGFDNYRFFNHGQTVTLPLLGLQVVFSMQNRTKFWRTLGWVGLTAWWMLLYVSSGRGTFVGVLFGMLLVGLKFRSIAWPWLRVMLIGAFVGLLMYIVFYILTPHFAGMQAFGFLGVVVERSVKNLGSSRESLWLCASEMIFQKPWFGHGPLSFAKNCSSMGIAAHPHNWFLQIAAEWGGLALLCLLFALYKGVKALLAVGRLLQPTDFRGQAILTCWLAIAFAVLVDGLVSGLIVMPLSQLWIAVYIGLSSGWARSVVGKNVKNGIFVFNIISVVVVMVVGGILVIGIMATRLAGEIPENNAKLLSPRAWGYGFLE